MSKSDKMFEELGYIKTPNPTELEPVFNDYYSEGDCVYEYYNESRLTCRIYFVDKSYGYAIPDDRGIENNMETHLAIHEKLKELGWI